MPIKLASGKRRNSVFMPLWFAGRRQIRCLFVRTARCELAQYRQHSMLWDLATKAVSEAAPSYSVF